MQFNQIWNTIHELWDELKWLACNYKNTERFSTEIIKKRKQRVLELITKLTIVFDIGEDKPLDNSIGLTMLEELGVKLPPND
jgi:hypothetical protein